MRNDSELIYICEICQTVLDEHHCKAVCPNCGRMFDCSDLPLMPANATFREDTAELTPRPGSDPRDVLPKSMPASDASGAADGGVANLP